MQLDAKLRQVDAVDRGAGAGMRWWAPDHWNSPGEPALVATGVRRPAPAPMDPIIVKLMSPSWLPIGDMNATYGLIV
jgi:hypothetical protein